MSTVPVYLDCNATTPIDPQVESEVVRYLNEEFGNANSRTHLYGASAKKAVEGARSYIATVVGGSEDEVIFTSGATESNNLAILGLASYGEKAGRKHIVSTQIEHKAVLEPLEHLEHLGFDITLVPPNKGGWVEPEAAVDAVREDTLLISIMHVNNETGVVQPIGELVALLQDHPAYIHTDAAQGFGKDLKALQNPRIDLISVSGHKIYAPKGVGALITRRRKFERPPLEPLMYGGGHEYGLRPGTIPVHLVVGLGKAAQLSVEQFDERREKCIAFKKQMLDALNSLNPQLNGDPERTLPNAINISFPGLDAEAQMVSLKNLVAISNGSACTSQSYEPSHVLRAMKLSNERIQSATRWSWYHMTETPDWDEVVKALKRLM